MSDENKKSQSGDDDPKAKFREALEKKKQSRGMGNKSVADGRKVTGGQTSGNTPKLFRRKSGSS